jgi:hypothetical protein
VLYAAGCLALLSPTFFFEYPLTTDYLNHLSRVHILYSSDPFLKQVFETHFGIIPNLAIDGGAWVAHSLNIDENIYLKGFYLGSALLMWAGIVALYRAIHGRLDNSVLLALPLQYSFVVTYGFMDFVLGMGIALFALAWVIRKNLGPVVTTVALNIFGTLAFFSHLGAFAIMVVSIFLYRLGLGRIRQRNVIRNFFRSIAEGAIPVALYCFAYHADVGGVSWATIPAKLSTIYMAFDVGSRTLALGMALLFALFVGARAFDGDISLPKDRRPLVYGLTLLAVLAPFEYHGSYEIDTRLVWFALLVFMVAIEIRKTTSWIEPFTVFLALGIVAIDVHWSFGATGLFNQDVAELRAAEEQVKPHSFVLFSTFEDPSCQQSNLEARILQGLPSLVTIDRDSPQPYIFAHRGMEAVSYRKEYEDYFSREPRAPLDSLMTAYLAQPFPYELRFDAHGGLKGGSTMRYLAPFLKNWPNRFSYVLHISGCTDRTPYDGLFTRVAKGSFFSLYTTEH